MKRFSAYITEVLNSPYSIRWTVKDDDEWQGIAKTSDNDAIEIYISKVYNTDRWVIDFIVNGSMQVTGGGDQFRIFATIIKAIEQWWKWLSKSGQPVEYINFSSSKNGSKKPNDGGRGKLYKRFAKQFANKIKFDLKISDKKDHIDFDLKNPKYKG